MCQFSLPRGVLQAVFIWSIHCTIGSHTWKTTWAIAHEKGLPSTCAQKASACGASHFNRLTSAFDSLTDIF